MSYPDGSLPPVPYVHTAVFAVPPGTSLLIASALGVDLNTAGDTAMLLAEIAKGKFYGGDYVIVTNATVSLAAGSAAVGIWSGAGATGQEYASFASLTSLVGRRDWVTAQGDPMFTSQSNGTMLASQPFVNVQTPLGFAGKADFYLVGRLFS